MSIKLMSLVWDYAGDDLSPSEALVLLSYADFADGAGAQAWPAYATVAQRTKLSRKSVMRAAQTLGEKGFLRRVSRRRGMGTIVFEIVADRLLQYVRQERGQEGQAVPPQLPEGTGRDQAGDTESTGQGHPVPQSTKNPQRTDKDAAVLDEDAIPPACLERAQRDGWSVQRARQEWEVFALWHQEKGTVPKSQGENPWLRHWATWRRNARARDPVGTPPLAPAEAVISPLIAEAKALANIA